MNARAPLRAGARALALLLAGLCVSGTANAGSSGIDLGKVLSIVSKTIQAATPISQEQEIEIGRGMAARLLGAAPLVRDAELQRYLNRVGRWLALHSERPDLPWHFALIRSPAVNAFAAPGGYVFVTQGMFARMHSEAELAGVLGHEIVHVVQKHHLEAIRKKAGVSIVADVADMALQQRHAYFATLVNAGTEILKTGLDRDDELQADRMGVVIAARSGYDPYGLPHLLSDLERVQGGNPDMAFFLSTHPPLGDRIAALDGLMADRLDRYASLPEVQGRFLALQRRVR